MPIVELKIRLRGRFTIVLGPKLLMQDLADILLSVNQFYSRYLGLYYFIHMVRPPLTNLFRQDKTTLPFPIMGLADFIQNYDDVLKQDRQSISIHSVSINSPGIVSFDGAGDVINKLIDLVHKGDLDREQLEAVIDRIRAETRLANASALEKEVSALQKAVAVMKSLGLTNPEIQSRLLQNPNLRHLLADPLVTLDEHKREGNLIQIQAEEHPQAMDGKGE